MSLHTLHKIPQMILTFRERIQGWPYKLENLIFLDREGAAECWYPASMPVQKLPSVVVFVNRFSSERFEWKVGDLMGVHCNGVQCSRKFFKAYLSLWFGSKLLFQQSLGVFLQR